MLILSEPDNTLICGGVPSSQPFKLPLPSVIQCPKTKKRVRSIAKEDEINSLFVTSRKRRIFTLRSEDIVAHVLLEVLVANFNRSSICIKSPLFPILGVSDIFTVGPMRVTDYFIDDDVQVFDLRRVVLVMLHLGNLILKILDCL